MGQKVGLESGVVAEPLQGAFGPVRPVLASAASQSDSVRALGFSHAAFILF